MGIDCARMDLVVDALLDATLACQVLPQVPTQRPPIPVKRGFRAPIAHFSGSRQCANPSNFQSPSPLPLIPDLSRSLSSGSPVPPSFSGISTTVRGARRSLYDVRLHRRHLPSASRLLMRVIIPQARQIQKILYAPNLCCYQPA